ncbi:thrombospondin type 3 repeat-containing protein [uncultured Fibrella sp.]|uniref:thrombospondin type 3 repeat-containing protein n=1 Tax=uncultured Fibrella sp. TaxID=1284596 RepID=UPI0035CBE27F
MKTKLGFSLCWLVVLLGLTSSVDLLAGGLPVVTDGPATGWLTDTDGDGVDDLVDLCPGTPAGTTVNAYGCPLSLTTCDYTTSTVTLTPSGGTSGTAVTTRYVLTSNTGTILQIQPTASFTGLSGTATYMAVALTYNGPASNLTVGSSLSAVSASCFDWSDALVFRACVKADADGDGVSDDVDLCPGTLPNTVVNAYGCPLTLAACDYTTSTVTLATTGGTSGTTVTTRYVLASNTGTILQISPTPSFSGLSGTATYMAVALTYEAPVSGLAVGNALSAVAATCFDWSDALVFKACVAAPATCDYQIGQPITLQMAGGSSGAGIKTSYVLTDATGKLVQVSSGASFASISLVAGTYSAYAVTYADDNSMTNLVANGVNRLSQITASCFAVSPALPLTLCGSCISQCLPLVVTRIR